MNNPKHEKPARLDKSYQNRLYPKDQEKVDAFTSGGINAVERKPFRPVRLLIMLVAVILGLSAIAQGLAHWWGVY